jgi:hypothetical protein
VFRNYVMKIKTKFSSRHLVRLREKLKLTEKNLHIRKFIFCNFPVYWSSVDFSGWFMSKRKSLKTFDISTSKKSVFLKFLLVRGAAALQPTPSPPAQQDAPVAARYLVTVADPSEIQTEPLLNIRHYRDSISVKVSLYITVYTRIRPP